ncbi:MAG TPA: class I SAM-dependent methyltransferase [Longimicrobium sp.]|nr:class I SAM-dependent methyltransferase [Longimicrobium sp.]
MTDVPATAAEYFGARAESYDSLIRRAVPRYDEMIGRLVACLPPRAGTVLELGCGTGNLSLALARRYPHARLVYVDASREMLELTAARLHALDAGTRTEGLECRFEDLPPGRADVDLVVSSISMHHVARKGDLFRAVHGHLRPGGAFRWADQLAGSTPALHAMIWEQWLEFCRLPGNCSEEEIQSLLDHASAHDHYEPLPLHLGLLHDAGFVNVDCVWRNLMWTVVVADRPAEPPQPPG